MTVKAYFDGACEKANPTKLMGMGFHIDKMDNTEMISSYSSKREYGSNNCSEYLALIDLLNFFHRRKELHTIHIHGDSQMVVDQMTGLKNVRGGMYKRYYLEAKDLYNELVSRGHEITFTWIPREINGRADELSKKGLDGLGTTYMNLGKYSKIFL